MDCGGMRKAEERTKGVVRRWNTRGGTGMANSGFVREWKGGT
jgi:hypothetical protein